jgi:hypothetical protein
MRILTISDKVEPVLYGEHIRQRVGSVDLVLACGDLPYYYLEYIVSSLDVPLYYVHGNHDVPVNPATAVDFTNIEHESVRPGTVPPFDWATNLHGRTAEYRGLMLAGLEGCRVYNPGARYQYSEVEVARQAFWLSWRLLLNRLRCGRYLDVLITHSPPFGIHDARDVAHTGFYTYLDVLRRYCPILMVHGHHHVYSRLTVTDSVYHQTRIVNTYPYRIIELTQTTGGHWEVGSTTL